MPAPSRFRPRALVCAALAVLAVFTTRPVAAQAPHSDADLLLMVTRGLEPERIVKLINDDCIKFRPSAAFDRKLAEVQADPRIVSALRSACYQGGSVLVRSEPAGAEVWVAGRKIGLTPLAEPIAASGPTAVEVRRDTWSKIATIDVPDSSTIEVLFQVPMDTVALPAVPTRRVVAQRLGLDRTYSPRIVQPKPPAEPAPVSRGTRAFVGMILGGAIGGAAMSYACPKIPQYWEGNQKKIGVDGGAISCQGGTLLGGMIIGAILPPAFTKSNDARANDYQAALARHRQLLASWNVQLEADKEQWLQSDPAVTAAVNPEIQRLEAERARLHMENDRMTARNRAIAEPSLRALTARRLILR